MATPPLSSMAVKVTGAGSALNVWLIVAPDPVDPSPKSHLYSWMVPSGSVEPVASKVMVAPLTEVLKEMSGGLFAAWASVMLILLSAPIVSAAVAGVVGTDILTENTAARTSAGVCVWFFGLVNVFISSSP